MGRKSCECTFRNTYRTTIRVEWKKAERRRRSFQFQSFARSRKDANHGRNCLKYTQWKRRIDTVDTFRTKRTKHSSHLEKEAGTLIGHSFQLRVVLPLRLLLRLASFLPSFSRTLHRCNRAKENRSSVNSADVNSMRRIYPHRRVLKQHRKRHHSLAGLLKPQYPALPDRQTSGSLSFSNRAIHSHRERGGGGVYA